MTDFNTKYRPRKFVSVVGQKSTLELLKALVKSKNKPPALLFTGPSGVGKTTLARIVATYLNCETNDACGHCESCLHLKQGSHPDLVEENSANSRGIDDVRSLIELSSYKPTFKYKVIILDEAHGYTKVAFDALLKTLEEPSNQTIFILCSTEPAKIPKTNQTRCRRFNLEKPTEEEITEHLLKIATKEKVELSEKILTSISSASNGHVRDAVNLLENAVSMKRSGSKESSILSSISSVQSEEDRSAADAFKAILNKDLAEYCKTALLSKEPVQFTKSLLRMSLFSIGLKNGVTKTNYFWPMPEVFAMKADITKTKLSRLVYIQKSLTNMHSELMTFLSPEGSVLIKYATELFEENI